MTRLDCKIITDFSGLAALADEWDRLWLQSTRQDIFNSFAYVSAWWSVHGGSYKVFTPLVFEDSRLVAVLPLLLKGRTLHFMCYTDADAFDVLGTENDLKTAIPEILRCLEENKPQWDLAVLDNIPENSAFLRVLHSRHSGIRSARRVLNVSPTLDLHTGREEAFSRLLGGKRNRQEERRLERFGEITFRHLESREEIRSVLNKFFEQHSKRWAVEGTRGRFTGESSRKFYQALVEYLDPKNTLRFSVLRAGKTDMAYHLGFQTNGRFLFFKPTFDVDYWEYSPGKVLLQYLLSYVRDNGLNEFDFSIGDEDYKKKFANRIRSTYQLILSNPRVASRIEHAKAIFNWRLRETVPYRKAASAWRSSALSQRMRSGRLADLTAPACQQAEAGRAELQEARLSWMAEATLNNPAFFSLKELTTARARMKQNQRFMFLSSESGICGAWVSEAAGKKTISEIRSTSKPALHAFHEAVKRMPPGETETKSSLD